MKKLPPNKIMTISKAIMLIEKKKFDHTLRVYLGFNQK